MEKDWKIARTYGKAYLANIAIEVLADNNITGVIMNKKDSSYLTFGDIDVYVEAVHLEKAIELLKDV